MIFILGIQSGWLVFGALQHELRLSRGALQGLFSLFKSCLRLYEAAREEDLKAFGLHSEDQRLQKLLEAVRQRENDPAPCLKRLTGLGTLRGLAARLGRRGYGEVSGCSPHQRLVLIGSERGSLDL